MVTSCPCCGAALPDDAARIDFESGMVVGAGHVVTLTAGEFAIFAALWESRGRTVGKERLLYITAGIGPDDRDIRIVDVWVHKARRKLEAVGIAIQTVRGEGYRIVPRAPAGAVAPGKGESR